ncbi:aldo/keto reductase [Streptomyces sp. NBC_00656]|uniref:aldo/keto reductase n=1 Tax=Streptomyces sp. NBC_00656 TaxID=2903668 RepID=UPI003254538A
MTESLGLGAALWSPLGGGLLTGKYRGSAEGRLSDLGMVIRTESTGRKSAVVDTVLAIVQECGVMPAQVAVAWVRERAARSVATLVPVIGPRSLAQLDGYLGALGVRLTDEQYTRLTRCQRGAARRAARGDRRLPGPPPGRCHRPDHRPGRAGGLMGERVRGHNAPAPRSVEQHDPSRTGRRPGRAETPPVQGRDTERRRR